MLEEVPVFAPPEVLARANQMAGGTDRRLNDELGLWGSVHSLPRAFSNSVN